VRTSADATAFVRGLFAEHGERLRDLEVRRASLEDTYLSLVHAEESGESRSTVGLFEGAGR
jgi:ABC-2 type transport system ATP-binding protein